jgi:high-affinity iron transporter
MPGADPSAPDVRARVAAVRVFGAADDSGGATAAVFTAVRRQLDSSLAQAHAGKGEAASTTAFDAYMTFEQVERQVRAKNPALADALEAGFAALRTRAAGGATAGELASIQTRLLGDLENAERTIGDRLSPLNLFFQSFILLLREGLEAILVVGALVAFLLKTGAGHRRRDIHVGVGAAVGASLLTAVLLETLFQVSQASQEALEGGTMLVACAMLFYVSYWLLSKMEVAKWNRFVKSRVQDAVSSGSALALASVAFLAVYREGFETVLFYKALFLSGGPGDMLPVLAGMIVGGVALGLVYLAINRFGVRIPLRPFFGFTSTFLYYMAFVFAGKGAAELQEGGVIGTTVLPWAPRLPALGVYPTAESLVLQALLLVLLVAGLVWTFVMEPRRLPVTDVLVPEPLRDPGDAPADRHPGDVAPPDTLQPEVLLRSLDRMDADLAELRAEVERLKGLLAKTRTSHRR